LSDLKIVSLFPFSSSSQRKLREVAQMEICCVSGMDELVTCVRDAQIICSHWLPDNWREIAPNLSWLQSSNAGVDGSLPVTLLETAEDVVVTTATGIHAIAIGEYVFGSILMFNRLWPELVSLQNQHVWPVQEQWSRFKTRELRGQTIGIVGFGNIGRRVAHLSHAFGMRVLAMRRQFQVDDQSPDVDQFYPGDRLVEMLRLSDYVVLAVPLTAKTWQMIGEEELRAMRSHAYLVNVGRGRVIDERILLRALTEGWIAGAGLDVTETEPLPASSPLYSLANVILTPHISGETLYYDTYLTDLFAENVRRYRRNEPLLNLYSRENKY
jgi:phosphoglycerate dehydrogenase-like enzyme